MQEGAYKEEGCCWLVCRGQVQIRNVLLDSKTSRKDYEYKYAVGLYFFWEAEI
jgi:hypothetical protein